MQRALIESSALQTRSTPQEHSGQKNQPPLDAQLPCPASLLDEAASCTPVVLRPNSDSLTVYGAGSDSKLLTPSSLNSPGIAAPALRTYEDEAFDPIVSNKVAPVGALPFSEPNV